MMLKSKFEINQDILTQLNEISWPIMVSFLESKTVDSLVSMNDGVFIDFLPQLWIIRSTQNGDSTGEPIV